MTAFIVCGGVVDALQLKQEINKVEIKDRLVIACDGGIVPLSQCGIKPDFAIGDFDSAGQEAYELAVASGIEVIKLNPIKDDTDSEASLKLAMEQSGEGDIIILGCTGTRLDHVIGNISLLGMAIKAGRRAYLLDCTNRIQMMGPNSSVTLNKATQYGKYVSLYPYMGKVTGVTLEGFKYPLSGYTAEGFSTITISNEIVDEEATITIGDGYMIVMETTD